jgi:hypothetical protein
MTKIALRIGQISHRIAALAIAAYTVALVGQVAMTLA